MNRNEVEKHSVSQEQLDALFARNNAQSLAERNARVKAAEWPHEVDKLLAMLAHRAKAQADQIASLEAKVAAFASHKS